MHFVLVALVGLLFPVFAGCRDSGSAPVAAPEQAPAEPLVSVRPAPAPMAGETASEESPRPQGTGILICDRYIRMVCSCARKRQDANLGRACNLAQESLPEWKNSHREDSDELAVVKACHRAFMHIQSTGQCDDITY